MLQRIAFLLLGMLLISPALLADSATSGMQLAPNASGVTLEQIMANPDWIGNPPEHAYWGYDSRRIYYWQKRNDSTLRDLYAANIITGAVYKVADSELGRVSAPGDNFNTEHTFKVFERDNNVFVRALTSGVLRQLTRDTTPKSDPSFMSDGVHVAGTRATTSIFMICAAACCRWRRMCASQMIPPRASRRRIICRQNSRGCSTF